MTNVGEWHSRFEAMQRQEQDLRQRGLWVSGPSDLLSIGGVAARELTHSAIVGWLLTPTGRHGLGTRLLADILNSGWQDPVPDLSAAVVQLEVPRDTRRADVVVTAGALTLVIENKVWSAESDSQCEDLYRLWHADGDVRFLLLSPTGYAPRETRSQDAAAAWRTLSYAALADWLERNASSQARSEAAVTIAQYLATLRRLFSARSPFRVGVGGGYVLNPESVTGGQDAFAQ